MFLEVCTGAFSVDVTTSVICGTYAISIIVAVDTRRYLWKMFDMSIKNKKNKLKMHQLVEIINITFYLDQQSDTHLRFTIMRQKKRF